LKFLHYIETSRHTNFVNGRTDRQTSRRHYYFSTTCWQRSKNFITRVEMTWMNWSFQSFPALASSC